MRDGHVFDVDDVGASMTFATVTITRTTRSAPPRDAAPDDVWAAASRTRPPLPAAGADAEGASPQDPPF